MVNFAHVIRRRVRHFKRAPQQFGLPWRGLEFDLRNQFHAFQYSTIILISQVWKGEVSASSPG